MSNYQEKIFCISPLEGMGATKKLIRKSDELLIFFDEVFKAFNLTYLSRLYRDGIGTFAAVCNTQTKLVVKASTGHYPLPFLIRDV